VELQVTAARAVELSAFRLEDAAGSRAGVAGAVPAGVRVVLAPDTAAVRARWNPPGPLLQASPWPALNHSGSGVAEQLTLSVQGVVVAEASLPGGVAEGVSWERTSLALPGAATGSWSPSLDPGGATPGRPNSRRADREVPAGLSAEVVALPSPFRPARDGTALVVIRPPRPVGRCRVEVWDSAGHRVAELAVWAHAPGEHRAAWDGRTATGQPAPFGLYLVRADVPGRRPRPVPLVLLR
jgi:hypothetical protein